jgi:hypothetical protein
VTDLIAGNIHIVHLGQIILEYAPLDPDPLLGLQPSLLLHHPANNNNQLHGKYEEKGRRYFDINQKEEFPNSVVDPVRFNPCPDLNFLIIPDPRPTLNVGQDGQIIQVHDKYEGKGSRC